MTSRAHLSHAHFLVGAAVLAAAALPLSAGTAHAAGPFAECTQMQVIGHRGYTQLFPTTEDTSEAWTRAAANGAVTVEGDLRTTSNGTWVVMHDSTVTRTTNGSGSVSSRSYDSLTDLLMYDRHPAYVSMSNLVASVHSAHPSVSFQLELKGGVTTASVQRLGQQLRDLGVSGQTTITSFVPSYLTTFRTVNPGYRLGLISDDLIPESTAMGYHVVIVNGSAAGLDADYVAAMHARGRAVDVWYLGQNIDAWRYLVHIGVDGYIANDPGQARVWCEDAQAG